MESNWDVLEWNLGIERIVRIWLAYKYSLGGTKKRSLMVGSSIEE